MTEELKWFKGINNSNISSFDNWFIVKTELESTGLSWINFVLEEILVKTGSVNREVDTWNSLLNSVVSRNTLYKIKKLHRLLCDLTLIPQGNN